MGCDYYIYTHLEIETAELFNRIRVRAQRRYFFPEDSDEKKYDDMVAYYLKPSYKPETVFEDGTIVNSCMFDEYEPILKTHFGDKWSGMLSRTMKIQKVETRVER